MWFIAGVIAGIIVAVVVVAAVINRLAANAIGRGLNW